MRVILVNLVKKYLAQKYAEANLHGKSHGRQGNSNSCARINRCVPTRHLALSSGMAPAIPVITLKRVDAGKLYDFFERGEIDAIRFLLTLLEIIFFLLWNVDKAVSYIYVNWMTTDR